MSVYPGVVDPAGIDAAGKVGLYFVAAIANTAAPKVSTELSIAGSINLTNIVYGWDPGVSQGTTERVRYGYENAATNLGRAKYDPVEIEYDVDPQNVALTTGDYKHVAAMAGGTTGFIVDRRGLAPTVAFAADQVVDVYPVTLGVQQPVVVDAKAEGEKFRFRQKVSVRGDVKRNVKLVA